MCLTHEVSKPAPKKFLVGEKVQNLKFLILRRHIFPIFSKTNDVKEKIGEISSIVPTFLYKLVFEFSIYLKPFLRKMGKRY
jgi:hypothetical protein